MTVTGHPTRIVQNNNQMLGSPVNRIRITGTWADAEDAADEALARLVALDPSDAPRNAEAWLTTVATRLCLDRLRRRKREDYIGAWLPEPVDTALLPAELAEQRDELRIAVLLAYEQLGPDERAAFVLREAYELPYAEIAEALHAATAMGAAALDRDDVGVLAPGRAADIVLLDAPSYVHLAYRPGVPLVAGVWQAGRPVLG